MNKILKAPAVLVKAPTWKYDCADLPFSRRTDEAASESIEKSLPIDEVDLLGRKQLRLRKLAGKPILQWPILLPRQDPRGLMTGAGFESWHKAQVGKTGISGNHHGIKSGRNHPVHSRLEARILAYFDMCPFVIDIRTQYPSWDRGEFERYRIQGRPFPKNKVMTIDFLLTLLLPPYTQLHYHGVSGKRRLELDKPSVVARHGREVLQLGAWGATHEVMDEYTVPPCESANYLRLKSWMLWTDIERSIEPSAELAQLIERSSIAGTLDRILTVLGRRLGHSATQAYSLFAVAVFIGYLQVDHRYPLRPGRGLCLRQCPSEVPTLSVEA